MVRAWHFLSSVCFPVSLPILSYVSSGDILTSFLLLVEKLKGKNSKVSLSGWLQLYTGNVHA